MLEKKLLTKILGLSLFALGACGSMQTEYFKPRPINEVYRCDENSRHMNCDEQFIYPVAVVRFK